MLMRNVSASNLGCFTWNGNRLQFLDFMHLSPEKSWRILAICPTFTKMQESYWMIQKLTWNWLRTKFWQLFSTPDEPKLWKAPVVTKNWTMKCNTGLRCSARTEVLQITIEWNQTKIGQVEKWLALFSLYDFFSIGIQIVGVLLIKRLILLCLHKN